MSAVLLDPRRTHGLFWTNLRLVVIDIETLWETGCSLTADAESEVLAAIEQVRQAGTPVLLRPQSRRTRMFQHRAIEAAGLTSESQGTEPDRAVEVRPSVPGAPILEPAPITHEGRHRAISIALVEVERGRIDRAIWHRLVNPGVPVDAETFAKHGITTERLAGAPAFQVIAPELLARLLPSKGETVVIVAHNATFDVGVLRTEFGLLGHEVPDLPILDTHGPLVRQVGVKPRDGSLEALLVALKITNTGPHTATGDALATASAAIDLLRRATDGGIANIETLLDATGRQHVATMPSPGRIRPARRAVVAMPIEHLERHVVLEVKPTKKALAAWIEVADECARLRCPGLGYSVESLVRTAEAPPAILLDALSEVLDRRAAAGDGPGANTALGGLIALFARFCPMPAAPGFTGNYPIRRRAAIAAYHRAMAMVAGLSPCPPLEPCPTCADGGRCPRDELARGLAPAVLDPAWKDGKLTRASTLLAWLRPDKVGGWFYHRQDPATTKAEPAAGPPAGQALADAATASFLRNYRTHGEEPDRVSRVRDQLARVVALGCANPAVIEMWVEGQASMGRVADLTAAIAECDRVLALRPQPSDMAWESLAVLRNHLAGRLTRLGERRRITPEGTIEVVRRHHPGAAAHRIRPLRFVRA